MKRILALSFVLAMVLSCTVCVASAAGSSDATTDGTCSSLELLPGASVRDAAQSGIRFETRILTSEYQALGDDVVIGTVIIPTDLVEGAITVNSSDATVLTSETVGVAIDGEYTVFYAAIVDIYEYNYARKFSARSFIKVGDDYYYTAYSDKDNARSIFEVAVSAWEDDNKSDAVKGYLDEIVWLSGAMNQIKIDGYTSPFTASYADGKLTIAGESALAATDISAIMIDDTVYTGGWDEVDGKLVANYSMTYYETFNGLTNDTATNASEKNGATMTIGDLYILAKADSITNDVKVAVKDAEGNSFDCLKIIYDVKDQTSGRIEMRGNLSELVTAGKTMLSISFSVKPDEGYTSVPGFNAVLGSSGTSLFKISSDSNVTLGGKTVATVMGATEYIDITIKIDLKNNCAYGYANGELVQTATYSAPNNYTTLADWAKANATSEIIRFSQLCNKASSAAACFDNLVVRVH